MLTGFNVCSRHLRTAQFGQYQRPWLAYTGTPIHVVFDVFNHEFNHDVFNHVAMRMLVLKSLSKSG